MSEFMISKSAETTAADVGGKPADTGQQADSTGPGAVEVLPILPLRDTVLFPGTIMPISVGRAASLQLLEQSLPQSKLLGLVLQKDKESENPSLEHLHDHGAIGRVIRMIRQGDKGVVVLVQGEQRMRIKNVIQTEPFMKAEVEILQSRMPSKEDELAEAAMRNLRESAQKLLELRPETTDEMKAVFSSIEDVGALTDILAANLGIETSAKQKLLEETDVVRRVATLQEHLNNQLHIADLQSKLRENVSSGFSDAQKRAYLREQLRAIQKELGEDGSSEEQVEDIRQRLDKADLPESLSGE